MKLYEPEILGAGISIKNKPTLPEHGVRKEDLDSRCSFVTRQLNNTLEISVELVTTNYVVSVLEDGEVVLPNTIRITPPRDLTISFLKPQSGTLTIAFFGE